MAVVTIKPFLDEENDLVGLKDLGLSSFPGTKKIIQVPIKNGRFLTGFDDKASYLDYLSEDERKKELKRIKEVCKEFETKYKHLNVCDCSADNPFYSKLMIELGAGQTFFDTNNVMDRIKLSIIETSAKYSSDSFVAVNFEEAATSNKDYFYYISNPDLDIEAEVNLTIKKDQAVAELMKIMDNRADLMLTTKFLLKPSKQLNDLQNTGLYQKLRKFIDGVIDGESSKETKLNYEVFLKARKLSKEELTTKVVIKYGIHQNVIRQKANKEWVYIKTGNELGKTPEEIYLFLSNTANLDIYQMIKEDVHLNQPLF